VDEAGLSRDNFSEQRILTSSTAGGCGGTTTAGRHTGAAVGGMVMTVRVPACASR